ncbi:uncharacterized protein [Clytia hemisphaerica]|uniref:uncharacterized protein n=1 Tax=Clytia hemisphaerica TaxID=252671 RepID=UPI0034D77B7D
MFICLTHALQLYILFFYLRLVNSLEIKRIGNGEKIESGVGENLQFTWKLDGLPSEDANLHFRLYYKEKLQKQYQLLSAENSGKKTETLKLEQNEHAELGPFDLNKISGSCQIDLPTATCTFQLNEADYTHTGEYFFSYFHVGEVMGQIRDRISLNIVGGPDRCTDIMPPQNVSCYINTIMKLSVDFCGNPEPKLVWKVGGVVINGTVDRSLKERHTYQYEVQFDTTKEKCGLVVSHSAIGYRKGNVTGKTLILSRPETLSGSPEGLQLHATVGIVVASVLLLLIVLVVICCRYCKNKRNKNPKSKEGATWGDDSALASAPLASENA